MSLLTFPVFTKLYTCRNKFSKLRIYNCIIILPLIGSLCNIHIFVQVNIFTCYKNCLCHYFEGSIVYKLCFSVDPSISTDFTYTINLKKTIILHIYLYFLFYNFKGTMSHLQAKKMKKLNSNCI